MAKDKKGFILYTDLIHTVKQLPDDKAGLLFKHILSYVNDESPVTDDIIVKIAFEPVKQHMKRDLDKWEEKIENRSVSGREGNLKRWNKDIYNDYKSGKFDLDKAESIAKSRKESQPDSIPSQPIANIADNVNVNVKVNDILKRKEAFRKSIKDFIKSNPDKYVKQLYIDFEEYWSEHGVNDKKMRFEKEKTFGLSRRLSSWRRNDFNNSYTPKKEVVRVEHWNNKKD